MCDMKMSNLKIQVVSRPLCFLEKVPIIFGSYIAANKGQSSVNYCQSSAFDHPYLLCNDHYDWWLVTFPKSLYYYYHYYFLEIILNDLELVFLEFKHLQNTQNKFVFFLSVQFFSHCFLISLCINAPTFLYFSTACKYTGWVCTLFARCFAILLYIVNAFYLLYFLHH